jgi:hypothetical protein
LLGLAEFCVCRSDQPTAVLQKAIDFSCGPQGNADCSAILQGGGCYNPNTVAGHCSWAANSYYQNNKAKGATCDFDGAATISTTDPSTTRSLISLSGSFVLPSHSHLPPVLTKIACRCFFLPAGFSGCTFPSTARYVRHWCSLSLLLRRIRAYS